MGNRFDFRLLASYHTIYLMDEAAEPDIPVNVTDVDVRNRYKVSRHIVVVYTESDAVVPVSVDIEQTEPTQHNAEWDYVVDLPLDVPSGRVVVAGCTDYLPDCVRIQVSRGSYLARVFYGKPPWSVSERYHIALRPAEITAPHVVFQRN